MSELRTREQVERWLAAGLCLRRVGSGGAVAAWISAALDEHALLPPPGVIADLGTLLGEGAGALAASAARPVPSADPTLRAAVRAYEDQLLARLCADARWEAATFALARLPAGLHAAAIALLAGHVFERLGFAGGVAASPALVRKALHRPADAAVADGLAELREHGDLAARLAAGYDALVRAARGTRTLLGEREIFALEHLATLGSLGRRVAAEQIGDAAEALGRSLPRRMRRRAARPGPVATRLEDESAYPIGGFAAVSTSGTLENLVTSELVYMDEAEDVDLFDMRYVEGELLYYTRDESIAVRRRHVVTFVLDASLVDARWKDAEVGWQRLVLALGMVVCVLRRLVDWLAEEALHVRVVFPRDARGQSPLAEERALTGLLLSEWIERGVATVEEAADPAAAIAAVADHARAGLSDLVHVGMAPPTPAALAALPRHVGVSVVRLDEARDLAAWEATVAAIVRALV